MATAKKLPSGSWRVQVYSHTEEIRQPDGTVKSKRIYKSFTSDDPSPHGKRKVELEAAQYAASNKKTSSITVKEAIDRYIRSKDKVASPSTLRGYVGMQKLYFDPLNRIQVDRLTTETVQCWVNDLSARLAPKTVKNVNSLLMAAVSMFHPEMHIPVRLPERKKIQVYIPGDADIKKLIEHVKGGDLEICIYLAAFGPMRRSEICALEADDISGNVVTVNKAMVRRPDNTWEIKQPKSYAGYRSIDYPDFVIKLLAGRKGRIFDMTPAAISNRFRRALKACKLPHFRFHDLRHYSTSVMHAIGIPDEYIMARGGWSTDSVMKEIYRHKLTDREAQMNKRATDFFSSFGDEPAS